MTLATLPALAMLLSLAVVISDLYAHRVPNAWLLAALLAGATWLVHGWVRGTGGPPWPALAGLLIGLGALLPVYVFGWMGAGDVKFFATLGFLLGAKALLPIWIIGSLLVGVHAVIIVMSRAYLAQALPGWAAVQWRVADSAWGRRIVAARGARQGLPYAAYLAIGALTTLYVPDLMPW